MNGYTLLPVGVKLRNTHTRKEIIDKKGVKVVSHKLKSEFSLVIKNDSNLN